MKYSIVTVLLLISAVAFAQETELGKITGDTLRLNNGATFVIGQKIKLGYGSTGNKEFEFVYTNPMSLAGQVKLGSGWANRTMQIKKFNYSGSKKTGKTYFLVLGGGNITNYWCDIVSAMGVGEVIVDGVNDPETIAKKNNPNTAPPASMADELAKLKKLYDDGALTKEEYEAAKKKLIGN